MRNQIVYSYTSICIQYIITRENVRWRINGSFIWEMTMLATNQKKRMKE